MNPLALFLGALGSAFNVVGDRWSEQAKLKDRASILAELQTAEDARKRPLEETDYKRRLLLSKGIDPDSLKPMPEFFQGITEATLARKGARGPSGVDRRDGKPGKGKGKSAADRRAGSVTAPTASTGNWFSNLFK